MKGMKKVFFIDIETYDEYDGTIEKEEEMIAKMSYLNTIEFFEKNKKVGYSYPVLQGNKDFTLGGISQWGRQKKWMYEERLDMKKKIIDITKQAMREGKNAVFYVHNGNFDMPRLFLEEYTQFDLINKYSGTNIWILTPKVELELECKTCGHEWKYNGGKEWIKCPKCNANKKIPCGVIRDTMNFIGKNTTKALANIGQELGVKKLEMPMEIKEPEELTKYLGKDLDILEKFVKSFYDMKWKLDNHFYGETKDVQMKPPITGSNFSMTQFLNFTRNMGYCKTCKESMVIRGLQNKKVCPKCKNKLSAYSGFLGIRGQMHKTKYRKELRDAFKGGVNKSFKQGRYEDIRVFDITSLYPSVTQYMPLLDPLSEKRIDNPNEHPIEDILEMKGIAEAEVEFPEGRNLGLLPMRWRGWGIYFPTCEKVSKTYTGTWTIDELKWAVKYGYKIKSFKSVITYKELPFNCLKDFEKELFNLRINSTGIFRNVIIKLLMNGLLLKFSQFKPKIIYDRCIKDDVREWEEKGWNIDGESPNGREWILRKELSAKFPRYAIPIWSIYVTAYSRMAILEEAMKIDEKDLLYIDTDAIHCTNWKKYENKLDIGKDLGTFKVEHLEAEHPLTGDYVKEKWYTIFDSKGNIAKQATSGATGGSLTSEQMHGIHKIVVLRNVSIARWIRAKNSEGGNKYDEDDVGRYEKVALWVKTTKRKGDIENKFPNGYIEYRKDNMEDNKEDEYENKEDLIE